MSIFSRLRARLFAVVVAGMGAVAFLAAPGSARAQAGSEDASYQPVQFNAGVASISIDPLTSQVVIGGAFSSYYEPVPINAYTTVPGVARVNPDGTPDKTFVTASSFGSVGPEGILGVAVQSDSKVIVGGSFAVSNSSSLNNLARLLSDGSLDAANLNLGSGPNDIVYAVAIQPDGKILVGGVFTSFNGSPAPGFVRLNGDLTQDFSFVPDTTQPIDYTATAIIVQPDGEILFLAGINSQPVRLTSSGALDTSFNTDGVMAATGGGDLDSPTGTALALQADGKVLAAVVYTTSTNGGDPYTFTESVVRLNADGTLDSSFDFSPKISTGTTDEVPTVRTIVAQPDGSVVVGGDTGTFASVGGMAEGSVIRLTPDGLLDGAFDATVIGGGGLANVQTLVLQGDGRLLVGSEARFPLDRLNDLNAIAHPPFFTGEASLGSGVYFLTFPDGNPFGYYSYLADPAYLYHFDLGYEYVFDANDGQSGVYFYDFSSGDFFYTSPSFPFPYLYDFSLNATLYYYPDTTSPGHYTTNPRYFFDFGTGTIITR